MNVDAWEYRTEYTPAPDAPGTASEFTTRNEAHKWVAEQTDPHEWRVIKRKVSPWEVDS